MSAVNGPQDEAVWPEWRTSLDAHPLPMQRWAMRIHFHPLSSYSRKVVIGIGLRGDPIEFIQIDPFAGDLRRPEFVEASPFGKMPVLTGTAVGAIAESTSILEYLEEIGPRVLLPVGDERLARYYDRLGDLYLLNPVGEFFWTKTDAVREKTQTTMARAWAIWEKALSDGRSFVCGKQITLGDLSAAVAAHYAETEGLELPEPIARYRDRLEANPVVAASRAGAEPFIEATRAGRLA
jgi:glutathione S-transferase